MRRMHWLAAALALVATFGIAGCGGGSDGAKETDEIATVIAKDLKADTGLHPGLTLGGLIFAVKDAATGYFTGQGVRAEKVDVSNVVIDKSGEAADADVSFDLVDQGVTCVGGAMATKSDGTWSLSGVAVTSCK